MTTVALVDRVSGQHRFVARGEALTTYSPPWSNVLTGVQAAVRQIEQLTGHVLMDTQGALLCPRTASKVPVPSGGGDGLDGCVVVSSAAPPMRVLLAGLTHDISLARARQAVAATHARAVGCLALDESMERRDPNAWLATLRRAQPEVIVIVGGTDGGASQPVADLLNLVALHNRLLPPEARPVVCYAGNADTLGVAAQTFAGVGELRTVANVSPSLEVADCAPLVGALDALYRDRWLSQVPGMSAVKQWANAPVAGAVRSFVQLVRYVGERYRLNVVGIDLGSAKTVRAEHAGNGGSARFGSLALSSHGGGPASSVSCADLGVGLGMSAALSRITLERITRWLPFDMVPEQAHAVLLNKGLHPQSVPQTHAELLLEYALAREVMREVHAPGGHGDFAPGGRGDFAANPLPVGGSLAPSRGSRGGDQWDLIIGAGRTLARVPHPGYAVLLLLDALEPVGISKLALDVSEIAGSLGALAASDPLAAVDVVEYDAFLTLGTVVTVSGCITPGETALRLVARCDDGRVVDETIPGGALRVIPLPAGHSAALEIHPARGLDVGVGRPGASATADAEGGRVGIVVDARGRPLELPTRVSADERRRILDGWLTALVDTHGVRAHEPVVAQEMAGLPCQI
jgi:hypothetical protein